MLLNIKTGYRGVRQREMSEIVILVSSLHKLSALGISFVFTDRHAYLNAAEFSSDLVDLDQIAWTQLQARDFKKDPENPEKMERYQAEALIHKSLPISALLGIICFNEEGKLKIDDMADKQKVTVSTKVLPSWYV